MEDDTGRKHGPADVVRDGQYKVSLWQNEGKERDYISAQPAKTYTDRDGNPRDTQNFSFRDLLPLSRLCETAYERGRERDKALREEQNSDRSKQPDSRVNDEGRPSRKSKYAENRQRGSRRQSRYVREQ